MKMKKDKLLHIVAGFIIAFVVGLFHPLLGLTIAVIVGACKELVYDKAMNMGTPELNDFIATAFGGIIGFLITYYK